MSVCMYVEMCRNQQVSPHCLRFISQQHHLKMQPAFTAMGIHSPLSDQSGLSCHKPSSIQLPRMTGGKKASESSPLRRVRRGRKQRERLHGRGLEGWRTRTVRGKESDGKWRMSGKGKSKRKQKHLHNKKHWCLETEQHLMVQESFQKRPFNLSKTKHAFHNLDHGHFPYFMWKPNSTVLGLNLPLSLNLSTYNAVLSTKSF